MSTFDSGLAQFLMQDEDWLEDERQGAALVYGPYGGGKTHLALTASMIDELSPLLVIDTEGSTSRIINKFDRSKIDVLRPRKAFINPDDPDTEYDVYPNTLEILRRIADGEETKYKTVIIDALDVFFNWGLAYYEMENPSDGFYRWSKIHSDLTESPSFNHVGLMLRLKEAPVMFIAVLHEKNEGEGEKSVSTFQWAGKGAGILGGVFDSVLHVSRKVNTKGEGNTTVLTQSNGKNLSKTRLEIPAKLVNPTMADILGLTNLEESATVDTDEE